MRFAAACAALLALCACAQSGNRRTAKVTAHPVISSVQTEYVPVRNGASGAPTGGLLVSGTISNTGTRAVGCRPSDFLLVDERGNATTPATAWCDVPSVAPQQSGTFSATFQTMQSTHLQLRFEHADGTYEAHRLTPPA